MQTQRAARSALAKSASAVCILVLYIGWRPYSLVSSVPASNVCRGIVSRHAWPSDIMLRSHELLPSVWDAMSASAASIDPDALALRRVVQRTALRWSSGGASECNNTLLALRIREKTFPIFTHSFVNVLLHALHRPGLAIRPPPLRVFGRGCGGNATMSCFTRPVSNCDGSQTGRHRSLDLRDRLSPLQQRMEYAIRGEDVLPPPWRHRGLFWVVSQLIAHILRPNQRVALALSAARKQLRLVDAPQPILALHVRRPAPCSPHLAWGRRRACDPLSAYMPSVRRLVSMYGYATVFLVSDDEETLRDAARNQSGDFHLVTALESHRPPSAKQLRQANNATSTKPSRHTTEETSGRDFGTRFMVLALLLAECEGFVGKFSSHMSRLVYSLMSAKHPTGDCLQPFISLDVPWCFGLNCDLAAWLPPAATHAQGQARFSGLPKDARYVSGSMLRLREPEQPRKIRRRDRKPTVEWDVNRAVAASVELFTRGGRTTS